MKVLVAEDDAHIREGLVELLEGEGYQPLGAEDGERAVARFLDEKPEFVFLDIMMPRMNGYDVLRKIRQHDRLVPVIFLSAKSEEIDKVLGLELGADDYVMKPFGARELMARVRAVARRCLERAAERDGGDKSFRMGDLEVTPAELRARRGAEAIELTLREVRILQLFARHQGEVLGRDQLYRECWGWDHFANSRTLDQHISKLRKKVERDPKVPELIVSVHGAGYRYP